MNAVIALCHFCESHGPSILFCTQPFHCSNHSPEEILTGITASPTRCGISHHRIYGDAMMEEAASNKEEINLKATVTRTSSRNKDKTCEACRSLVPGDPGFICIDQESHISYIGMQYPEDSELYSVLRHACVRSLSCEVCPGREGPIMFGDEASGYVFSHTFFLKDTQSRGFQRWYSLICVMMDRIFLANSWQFLLGSFKTIIGDMQAKADKVYKTEITENTQRDSLLQPRNAILTPDHFRRSRGGLTYRSLSAITRDKSIFPDLHKTFTWILKASGQRFTEVSLEGPPVEGYLYDEDDTNDVTNKIDDLSLEIIEDRTKGPIFESVLHMYQVLGPANFRLLAFHVVRGDQLIVQGDLQRTIFSAIKILKKLIPAGCVRTTYDSSIYQDSFICNFLGVKAGVEIPEHVLNSQLFVLLKVAPTENFEQVQLKQTSHFSSCENFFHDIKFSVKGSPAENEPTYLKNILDALKNKLVDTEIFETILTTSKEKWMGKVKVMFRFSKTGLQTPDEKDRMLKVLQARPEDEILLKYWMTSLSRSYRSQLLNCQDSKENCF